MWMHTAEINGFKLFSLCLLLLACWLRDTVNPGMGFGTPLRIIGDCLADGGIVAAPPWNVLCDNCWPRCTSPHALATIRRLLLLQGCAHGLNHVLRRAQLESSEACKSDRLQMPPVCRPYGIQTCHAAWVSHISLTGAISKVACVDTGVFEAEGSRFE